jgi:hypothetical protein
LSRREEGAFRFGHAAPDDVAIHDEAAPPLVERRNSRRTGAAEGVKDQAASRNQFSHQIPHERKGLRRGVFGGIGRHHREGENRPVPRAEDFGEQPRHLNHFPGPLPTGFAGPRRSRPPRLCPTLAPAASPRATASADRRTLAPEYRVPPRGRLPTARLPETHPPRCLESHGTLFRGIRGRRRRRVCQCRVEQMERKPRQHLEGSRRTPPLPARLPSAVPPRLTPAPRRCPSGRTAEASRRSRPATCPAIRRRGMTRGPAQRVTGQ